MTMAQKPSKFFRVCSEGPTSDGRFIKREWLEQIAKNYDPELYGARVNMEHLKSVWPDGVFCRYGDVVGVKTEEFKGALTLFAQIVPTDGAVQLTTAGQKVYPSIEIDANFAGTGEAYLTGMAMTDEPASLRTEMLKFNASNKFGRIRAGGDEVEWSALWETLVAQAATPGAPMQQTDDKTLLAKLADIVLGRVISHPAVPVALASTVAVANVAPDNVEQAAEGWEFRVQQLTGNQQTIAAQLLQQDQTIATLSTQLAGVSQNLQTLTEQLARTPNGDPARPNATGSGPAASHLTDC